MLTMQYPFTEMDIENVQVLRKGTVYKLTGHAGETLVVKVESSFNINSDSLKHAKVAMKAVDKKGGGNVKELSNGEKVAIKDWVTFMKSVTKDFSEDKVQGFDAGPAAVDLSGVLEHGAPPLWYKMPVSDLTDADKLLEARLGTSTGHADKSVMRQFADGLKADGGLEQIGKIVAADMYIGNSDRFHPTEGSSRLYGGKNLQFRAIKNIGNVFVVGKNSQQRIAFSGHDFIDPNSGYRNYDMSLSDIKEAYDDWVGESLCDAGTRQRFAKDIVHDLETILTPNRKSYSPFRKLGKNAGKRVERGMVAGMKDIVAAVDRKYANKMPAGVKQRRDKFNAAV